jgi:hypothetical protein
MTRFSPKVSNFLEQVGADPYSRVAIVPPGSCTAGDVLFFRYQLGTGVGSRAARLVLLVKPVFRSARTGNKLMTGFTLPVEENYNPQSLEMLHKLGKVKTDQGLSQYQHLRFGEDLPLEGLYRTYIVSNIFGPLRKIARVE